MTTFVNSIWNQFSCSRLIIFSGLDVPWQSGVILQFVFSLMTGYWKGNILFRAWRFWDSFSFKCCLIIRSWNQNIFSSRSAKDSRSSKNNESRRQLVRFTAKVSQCFNANSKTQQLGFKSCWRTAIFKLTVWKGVAHTLILKLSQIRPPKFIFCNYVVFCKRTARIITDCILSWNI